ncbi:MAG: hypothetical protein A2287_00620 [Candidatus Melainabacteria bacterium RIFOXYA12_FULL_32_12]|nr:MAG: hypothetical protein A2287_00620 [Candidatus Melainabacteria bacterium RIFOXYA12_FULL_32_12]
MKRQIINSTDHLVLDADKIMLMKIQQQNSSFCLNVCLENLGTYTIGTFDDKADAIEVFNDISGFIWNKEGANIFFLKKTVVPVKH